MIPQVSQLPTGASTVLMLVLLITAFIVAFKVTKMVFETVMVSVLSALFYVALTVFFFQGSPTVDDALLYAFLGSAFYMGYSFLMSAYSMGAKIVSIPYYLLKLLLKPFAWVYSKTKEEYKLKRIRQKLERKEKDFSPDRDEKSTKDVVLDKVKGEDKEN